jgi:hypothetical protein
MFGCCYLQITINFLVYQQHQQQRQRQSYRSDWKEPTTTTSHWFSLSRSFRSTTTTSPLFGTLITLQTRAERMLLQIQQQAAEEEQQQQQSEYHEGSFLAFTIRDARRTVPTQIPYGFHVLDFVDVHNAATYGFFDDDDDYDGYDDEVHDYDVNIKNGVVNKEGTEETTRTSESSSRSFHSETVQNKERSPDRLQYPAPLFHNGYPVPYPYNTSVVGNATHNDCQDYSMACYRSSMIQVMRYLLESPKLRNVTYFFYMEDDHDLCVSLSSIRSMAYRYQRYIISVGTGASGWIMSRSFLQDFYHWYQIDLPPSLSRDEKVTSMDWLRPEVVATAMLRHKDIPWSLSRQYLTSHTILTSTAFDVVDQSLTDLFEFDVTDPASVNDNQTNATDVPVLDGNETVSSKLPKTTKVELLPALEPKVHLPRCLEPRKGIFTERDVLGDNDEDDNNDDVAQETENVTALVSSWNVFDYVHCPDAEISPCDDSELNNGASVQMLGKVRLRGATSS